jgi:hypothetical protein
MPPYYSFRSIASFCLKRLKTSQPIWRYPVFAFMCVCFNSSENFLRRWCDLLQRRSVALRMAGRKEV